MDIQDRWKAPTPPFFKKIRMVGMALAAAGGAVLAAPVVLPVAVVTAAGYVVVAGSVLAAVSQVTVNHEKD